MSLLLIFTKKQEKHKNKPIRTLTELNRRIPDKQEKNRIFRETPRRGQQVQTEIKEIENNNYFVFGNTGHI